jgi:hypothetical protein
LHQFAWAECQAFQLELSGLYLADIQNVADQLQQDLRRAFNPVDVLTLLAVQPCGGQKFQRAQHAIQRRTDLVTHRGQKGGFRFAGLVRCAACALQRALDFYAC